MGEPAVAHSHLPCHGVFVVHIGGLDQGVHRSDQCLH